MVFSSPIFLFLFLPLSFILVFLSKKQGWRNFVLIVLSFIFYAWGEGELVFLMIFSILFNYLFGVGIEDSGRPKLILSLSVIFNIGLLIFFKYLGFLFIALNELFSLLGLNEVFNNDLDIKLPIGISFFTFQGLSYVIDVYRKDNPAQRNPLNLALYISLFPQLIAGPIVRYGDIIKELTIRHTTLKSFQSGINRFVFGLSKKVLIANTMASVADDIFAKDANILGSDIAWIGIIAYSLQIFFDFSGYSDMAIGLGKMFGFNFLENFNYPYISKSIQGFWRRWHISLSTWFKDYLYVPLGGNRKGKFRLYINLFIVFFLTGLWHGASLNFIIWGLFHGLFLVLERLFLGKLLEKAPLFLPNIYTILIVTIGWVFFRAENLEYGIQYIFTMFSFSFGYYSSYLLFYLTPEFVVALFFGIILSTNILGLFFARIKNRYPNLSLLQNIKSLIVIMLFAISIIYLASGTYNPFIYFRF